MIEESGLGLLVSNVLNEKRYSHCRLCLKDIQEQYVRLEDFVSVESTHKDCQFQQLSEILLNLLGADVTEDIAGLDAVCMECVDKALEAQKFLLTCQNSIKIINNVFSNLTETLDIDVYNAHSNVNLYVVVSEFESKLILIDNEVKKNEDKIDTYSCSECSEKFEGISHFKEHNLTVHNTFTCEKCYHSTTNEEEFNEHESSDHMYSCTECNIVRCTEESLKIHQDKSHGLYMCKDCGKSFRGQEKLHNHEQKHVSKSECPKCGKTYNTKEFFLKHVKLCLEDMLDPHPMRSKIQKTYFCDKCGKGYSTPGGLRVHHRFIHGNAKPHICKYCNKQFTAPSYLKVHMIKHTGEKNFKCNLCTRKFVSKEALLYHTRRHTGEKPYHCTMCSERFVNSSARAEHIKFKHVGPTLMCEICSRKFVTVTFLRQHMQKHHDPSNKLYTGRSLIPPNVPAVENMRVRFID